MCNETIKISIIVPIYNVENYVRPCIESIIGQSYKNLEIILVDDGSTDRCPGLCDDYAQKDERIHVIHKQNGGVTTARRAGTAVATGEYVLCVDGDDWIEVDRVETLVRDGIIPSLADMIHLSGFTKDFEDKSVCFCPDIPIKLFEKAEIENEIFPMMSAGIYKINYGLCMWAIRKELLLKNLMLIDDRAAYGEDFLGTCFCLLDAQSVMTIRQGGYHYIQRASSAMHQIYTHLDKTLLQVKILYQVLKNGLDQKHPSEKIRKICIRIAIGYMMPHFVLFLEKFPHYLFPFPQVQSGSRVVVYGAGKIGRCIVQHLDKTKKCSIVLWVDQNQNLPTIPGYAISPRAAILSADYDFIVVAIMNANSAKEVKRSLILDGIPEEKIATMDASVISEDAIPDEIRNFRFQ